MGVIETTKKILAQWHSVKEEEGYIIALPASHNNPLARVRFFQKVRITNEFVGEELREIEHVVSVSDVKDAELFPDFEEAHCLLADCRAFWGYRPDDIVILHIKRRPPFELVKDHPITLLDALAEA